MADVNINEIKSILQKALPNLTAGEIEKLAKAISGSLGAASINKIDIDEGLLAQAKSAVEVQERLVELQKESREEKQKDLEIALEIDRLAGKKVTQSEINNAQSDIELELAKERLETLKLTVANGQQEENKRKQAIEDEQRKVILLQAQKEQREELNRLQESGARIGENFAKTIGFSNKGLASQIGHVQGVGNKMKALGAIAKGVGVGFAAAFGPISIAANLLTFVVEAFMSINKVNADLYSQTGIAGLGYEAAEASVGMKSLSVSGKNAANAQMGLLSGIKDFRSINKELRKDLIQTTALMEGMGVSAEDSGEAIGFMQSALGMTVKEAEEGSRELVALAEQLGRPASEIVRGFNEASDSLAKYGPNMQREFRRLAMAANVLNMDVGKLMNTFGEGFDTFEGAQTKAAGLNALLGGPFLNGMELLGQTEAERVVTLKEALDAQGKTFDQMGKFERMGIAKQLGMGEKELGKLMNANAEDMNKILNAEEIAAKKKEDMDKKNLKNMDIMAQLALKIEKAITKIFGKEFFSDKNLEGIAETVTGFFEIIGMVTNAITAVKDFIVEIFGIESAGGKAFAGLAAAMLTIGAPMLFLKKGLLGIISLAATAGSSMLGLSSPDGPGGPGGGGGTKTPKTTGKFNAKDFTKAGPVVKNAAGKRLFGAAAAAALQSGKATMVPEVTKASKEVGRLGQAMTKLKGIGGSVFRSIGSAGGKVLGLFRGLGTALGSVAGLLPRIGSLFTSAFGGMRTLLAGIGGRLTGLIRKAGQLARSVARSSRSGRRRTRASGSKPGLFSRIGSSIVSGVKSVGRGIKSAGTFVAEKAVAAKKAVSGFVGRTFASAKDYLVKKAWPVMKAKAGGLGKFLSKVPVFSALLNGAMLASTIRDPNLSRDQKASQVVKQGGGMLGSSLLGAVGMLGGPLGSVLGGIGGQFLGEWIAGFPAAQRLFAPMIKPYMPEGANAPTTDGGMVKPYSPTQVDDGLIGAGPAVKFNSADQIVALKEGGLLDMRFKEMIKLLRQMQGSDDGAGGTPVVISMDGKKVAESVISQINKKYDLGV